MLVGIGIDSVDVPRFSAVLERRPSIRARVFTSQEQSYALGLADPVPSLAARFAAKEAVMKSLGVGLGAFSWGEVEVRRSRSGQPALVLTGRAAGLALDRGVRAWLVSLTHTASLASAVVAAIA